MGHGEENSAAYPFLVSLSSPIKKGGGRGSIFDVWLLVTFLFVFWRSTDRPFLSACVCMCVCVCVSGWFKLVAVWKKNGDLGVSGGKEQNKGKGGIPITLSGAPSVERALMGKEPGCLILKRFKNKNSLVNMANAEITFN